MRYVGIVAILSLLAVSASADWFDNFDSYNLGSINNQGGWKGWANVPAAAGTVTDYISRSPDQSQLIEGGDDSVRSYTGYTVGTWFYRAWVYIPTDFQGGGTDPNDFGSYFIMLNKYTNGGTDTRWSVQMAFNSDDHMIHADAGSSNEVTIPYVDGQWSQIEVQIYLSAGANGWTKIYYNGTLIDDPGLPNHPQLGGGYAWKLGVFGTDTTGTLNIGAVDLFANTSSAVYYDDMSLIPEPVSGLLLLTVALLRRR